MTTEDRISNAIFQLDDQSYYLGFWNIVTGHEDVLCIAWRPLGQETNWQARMRIREYLDDEVFVSKDRRSAIDINPPPGKTEAEVEHVVTSVLESLSTVMGAPCVFTAVRGDVNALMAAMRESPIFHMRMEKVGE